MHGKGSSSTGFASRVSRIKPTDWQTLVKVFQAAGFRLNRTTSSHVVMTRPGVARPVVIPKYPEVGLDIILSNMRTAEISRERYFQLLKAL